MRINEDGIGIEKEVQKEENKRKLEVIGGKLREQKEHYIVVQMKCKRTFKIYNDLLFH